MKNSVLKGSLLVAVGAASYGMLTTFVKMAYVEGFTIAEVAFSQYLLGFVSLLLLNFFIKHQWNQKIFLRKRKIFKLILAGTSFGLTTIFYYSAVQTISVSFGIVLLMQSVWLGVLLDSFLNKLIPTKRTILAVAIILLGTLLATNIFFENRNLSFSGIGFGLLAAICFTLAMFFSNRIATDLPPLVRSKWMLLGGLLTVFIANFPKILVGFNWEIFTSWGIVLAVFGSILPPFLLAAGMPKINLGLGTIISALELPVAVLMAYFLLNESVSNFQWIGIFLIIVAIAMMNIGKKLA